MTVAVGPFARREPLTPFGLSAGRLSVTVSRVRTALLLRRAGSDALL